ncbi:alpha/beta hydrolase [Geothrix oryzae]|uniref:Alpha/beta hydrolase n=1 Tax=Geothrix oryzae TaxID=2927975 RepID=A0ABN6UTV6_9BACT|nr:alpha/beta hydrolase [Geothrix oryzae]BDU68048.1 alpha/beta hydrolase [Geothrix oryzae]
MFLGWILGALALGALLIIVLAFGWLMLKRPLELLDWGTRRALGRAGLEKCVVPSPVGPQTVFVGGTGPLLVFLHGAGHQAGTWLQSVRALGTDYTLIIPDLAGHGESAPVTGPIQASDIVGGLEAVIASQAQGRPVTLIGNSLGGWMAMVLATRHPEWVERIVAVNGGPLAGTDASVRMLPATREEARETMARLRDASSPAIPNHVLDDLVRRSRSGPFARFVATTPTMGAWALTEAQLATIQVPVRLIWGVSDGLMPLAYAERMRAALPDVELFPLERCGHVPQQEAPERFLAALRQALG